MMKLQEMMELLWQRIEVLSRADASVRSVFDLCYIEDFNLQNTAMILDESETHVRQIIKLLEMEVGRPELWRPLLSRWREEISRDLEVPAFEKSMLFNVMRHEPPQTEIASRTRYGSLTAAAAATDVSELRRHFDRIPIDLVVARVHVTIEPDNDSIILHFASESDSLDGVEVLVHQVESSSNETRPSIRRTIQGGDITFSLSDIGADISELYQVEFRLRLQDREIWAQLDGRILS